MPNANRKHRRSYHQKEAESSKNDGSLLVDVDTHLGVGLFRNNMPKFYRGGKGNSSSSHIEQGDDIEKKISLPVIDDDTHLDSTDSFDDEHAYDEEIIEFSEMMFDDYVIPDSIHVDSSDDNDNPSVRSIDTSRINFVAKRRVYVTRRRRSLYCLSTVVVFILLVSIVAGIHSAIQIIESRKTAGLVLGDGVNHYKEAAVDSDLSNLLALRPSNIGA